MLRIIISIVFLCGVSAPASANTLNSILQKLSETSVKHAKFSETRSSSYLKQPIVSKGELEFRAPTTMLKRIQTPEELTQRIEGNDLTIFVKGEQKHQIYLPSEPELEIGINAIRWMLSGNQKALQENFEIAFINDEPTWSVGLDPKDEELSDVIKDIRINGKDNVITQITIFKTNGDTVKTILYEHN